MTPLELSERKKLILRTIVENYIETAEPVGSKVIAETCGLNVSSATVRNEMAELESMGYLEQPHTSAGRVPSPKGYRLYVNELMQQHRLTLEETEEINAALKEKARQLDGIISDADKIAASIMSMPAYAAQASVSQITASRFDLIYIDDHTFIIVLMLSNNTVKNKLVKIPAFVDQPMLTKLATVFNASFTGLTEDKITPTLISVTETSTGDNIGLVSVISGFLMQTLSELKVSETHVSGSLNILRHPEFQDIGKAQRLLSYLSDDTDIKNLPTPEGMSDIRITIGPENLAEELKDSSVIVARYDAGNNMQGIIGVVGPTRMDYSAVAARLSYIADGISRMLKEAKPSERRQLQIRNNLPTALLPKDWTNAKPEK